MEHPLVIEQLKKDFGELEALKAVSFALQPGELFGLLGPNGAGKTTLISILSSLLKPSAGKASIFGHDVRTDSFNARRLLGVVPQEIVSHGFFTVNEVLQYHSGFYGLRNNQKRIDFLLEKLGLSKQRDQSASELSGGMKRRLLIAKALVHHPPLLLLDEPTAGVDVDLRNNLWEFVRDLHKEGMTILLTTHYLQEAEELCERIGVLHQGALIELDETQKLIHELTYKNVTLTLTQPWQPEELPAAVKIQENIIQARIAHDKTVGELIKNLMIPLEWVQDISIVEGRLEDAFMSLIEQHKTKQP